MAVIRFAPRPAPDLQERGVPGTQFFAGFLGSDEYVPELQGSKALDVFDKMRRSDGMVKAVLAALKQPIMGAQWSVEPGSDAAGGASGQQIADHFARNLFDGMSMSWRDHLRQALTHLDFGFYVSEVVWHVVERDGRLCYEIRKLAPRLQRTIYKWNLADDGGLRGVTQQLFSGTLKTVEIPVDKLLVFTNEKEGANWQGTSALRPAYKHWFFKDHLYRFQGIQAERHATGIPTITLPDGKDDNTNLQRAEDIVYGVRTHERGGVVLPFGYTFDMKGMDGRPLDLMPAILHHDRAIALSVLAHQLSLGASAEGSNALSVDQSTFFLLAEKTIANHIADIHNRYLIPRWVEYNYGPVEALPKLRVGRVETRGLEKLWNALGSAAGQLIITPDDPLEDALREDAGLPRRDPATARRRAQPAPAPQPQPEGQNPGTEPSPAPQPEGGA